MIFSSSVRGGLGGMLFLALANGVVLAQAPTTRPANPQPGANRVPEYAGTAHIPEKVLNDHIGDGILLPTEPGEYGEEPSRLSGSTLAKVSAEAKPLPDGYVVGRRPGRVVQREGGYELLLDHVPRLPDAPPLKILPNARLTLLEAILADGGQERHFVVTGRITEFQGSNYVLLDNLAELTLTEGDNPSVPSPAPTPTNVTPTTKPAAETETRPAGHEPTAEELIHQLMKDKPTRTLVFPDEPQPTTAPAGTQPALAAANPATAERAHWPDETLLSDCQARLVPGEAGVWMLAFEDPGRKPTLRPIRILPSRLLETALNLTGAGSKPVVLVVSGEITAHRGTNYILLRKVLVRRDLGNLR